MVHTSSYQLLFELGNQNLEILIQIPPSICSNLQSALQYMYTFEIWLPMNIYILKDLLAQIVLNQN